MYARQFGVKNSLHTGETSNRVTRLPHDFSTAISLAVKIYLKKFTRVTHTRAFLNEKFLARVPRTIGDPGRRDSHSSGIYLETRPSYREKRKRIDKMVVAAILIYVRQRRGATWARVGADDKPRNSARGCIGRRKVETSCFHHLSRAETRGAHGIGLVYERRGNNTIVQANECARAHINATGDYIYLSYLHFSLSLPYFLFLARFSLSLSLLAYPLLSCALYLRRTLGE